MSVLATEDVEAIVRLLAQATDPSATLSVVEHKRLLIEGLAKLIQADVWIWTTSVHSASVAGDAMTVNLLDGGWQGEAERVGFYRFLTEPETAIPSGEPIARLLQHRGTLRWWIRI